MRVRGRVWKLALAVAVLIAGGLGFAWSYFDSARLAALIEREAPRYFPGSRLVVAKVGVRPVDGQVTLEHIHLRQKVDGQEFPTLRIAWLQVRHDLRTLL